MKPCFYTLIFERAIKCDEVSWTEDDSRGGWEDGEGVWWWWQWTDWVWRVLSNDGKSGIFFQCFHYPKLLILLLVGRSYLQDRYSSDQDFGEVWGQWG